MLVQVKDYFAVLFCFGQKSPFLKKYLKSDTIKLDIYCQSMNKNCLGLVPKQTGTGGKVRLLGISKRGDACLRTLFIHGARSAALLAREPNPWVTERMKRRPTRVAVVGMANKIARTEWALVAHNRSYDRKHVSVRPL